jgi:hypothetical protein
MFETFDKKVGKHRRKGTRQAQTQSRLAQTHREERKDSKADKQNVTGRLPKAKAMAGPLLGKQRLKGKPAAWYAKPQRQVSTDLKPNQKVRKH